MYEMVYVFKTFEICRERDSEISIFRTVVNKFSLGPFGRLCATSFLSGHNSEEPSWNGADLVISDWIREEVSSVRTAPCSHTVRMIFKPLWLVLRY